MNSRYGGELMNTIVVQRITVGGESLFIFLMILICRAKTGGMVNSPIPNVEK
jgi:hypothetical protein